MVFKMSEYQKQFSEAVLMKHIPIYEANLECRNRRRHHQFSHTSIAWDDDTDQDTPSTSEEDVIEAQEKMENLQIKKDIGCQITPLSYHQKVESVSSSNDQFSKRESEPSLSEHTKRNISNQNSKRQDLSQKMRQETTKKRSKRPDRKEKIPLVRPLSASEHNIQRIQHPKPLLSYGHGDHEKSTGILWSHNVRAGSQVYPSALRAKEQRKVEAKKREDRRSKYVWLNERKKNAILKLMKKETQDWETEYQKHYPAYEKMVYERALSARPDSRLQY